MTRVAKLITFKSLAPLAADPSPYTDKQYLTREITRPCTIVSRTRCGRKCLRWRRPIREADASTHDVTVVGVPSEATAKDHTEVFDTRALQDGSATDPHADR